MARRVVKDTFGRVDVGGGLEARHQYLAGAEIPDTVRVEDSGAVEEFEADLGPGTHYRDYQIAEGANSGPHDPSKVKTEEFTDDAGNTIRRTRASREAQEHQRLRERSVGQVAQDDEKAAKSRSKSSGPGSE